MAGEAIFIIVFGVLLVISAAYAIFSSNTDNRNSRRRVQPQ